MKLDQIMNNEMGTSSYFSNFQQETNNPIH